MPETTLWERILDALQDKGSVPNTFTRHLGKQLKKARQEAGISQSDLAEAVYRRRPSISDMENGLMMPDFGTIFLIANHLDKSILYFIPPHYLRNTADEDLELTDLEKELLVNFRRLNEDEQKIAIKQVRVLTD
ncbi:MAG: helix-turn-helix transcriptional regulator [Chloroflexota bacterium]